MSTNTDGPMVGSDVLIKLDPTTLQRATALIDDVKEMDTYREMRASRATVLRAAIDIGLQMLEVEASAARKRRSR